MDRNLFDHLARVIATRRSRRALGGMARGGAAAIVLTQLAEAPATDAARRKRRVAGEHNIRGSKVILCYQGETVRKPKKQRKKWLKRGATRGPCSGCTPVCSGCGGSDGCGGTCGCASAQVCAQGVCCTPVCNGCGGEDGCGGMCGCPAGEICAGGACAACTVTCAGSPASCGTALAAALTGAGPVYVCPGVYQGTFAVGTIEVYGAGSGDDATANTILDANRAGVTMTVATLATAKLANLRITGGRNLGGTGGGVRADSGATLEITGCVVTGNEAGSGGGVDMQVSSLTMRSSQVVQNTAEDAGGVACNGAPVCTFIDSLISVNTATVTVGGGLTGYNTPMIFTNTDITRNRSGQGGGGVLLGNGGASATFDSSSTVTGNTANVSGFGAGGGGIFNGYGGTLALNGATVSGNSPDDCVGTGC